MSVRSRLGRPFAAAATLCMIIAAVAPSLATELAGTQGTDTSLPATPSAVTLSGRGQFSSLQITVNQTSSLVNQAVSITWSGGVPTVADRLPFASNFLQIMQCWGDDDGTVPSNPGPSPQQCVFGASNSRYGAADPYTWGFTSTRALSNTNWPTYDPSQGVVDPNSGSGQVWMPFRGVAGDVTGVALNVNFDPNVAGGSYWLNPDFDAVTTNEIAAARTGADGKGAELFQVDTGEESSGLGCGQSVEPLAGGGTTIPKCWLVIVPRGTGPQEDVGANLGIASSSDVVTSPLSSSAWKNRIAFPLTFNPLNSPCALAANQVQVAGNELAATAISSWQPALCASGGHGPYAYSVVPDATARLQLQSNVPGGAGMIVVNQPFDQSAFLSTNPVVYAPLTLSATVVGFNVERNPGASTDPAVTALGGVRFADINLTPRLLAKLLTESYSLQVAIQGPPPKDYTWATGNPPDMSTDPDFLQFNPEFTEFSVTQRKDFGGLVLPLGNSDQAQRVWQYVLADPEAKAWLDGKPDPWGMRVNSVYATVASANSTGAAFAVPVPNSFPKSDPYCYQAPPTGAGGRVVPPPICSNGWFPYATSLHLAAKEARVAADGAKIVENVVAQSPDQVWGVDVPQPLGSQAMLALTDSPSAAIFGIQAAKLSRAGDDGSARQFVAPDSVGMTAAVASMKANSVPGVLEPNPSATPPNAYPLTTLTYGVAAPLQLDRKSRQDYAYLLDYASGKGQIPGLQLGQLPAGYAPLPAALEKQAAAAAQLITTLTDSSPAPSSPTTSARSGGTSRTHASASFTRPSASPRSNAEGPSALFPSNSMPPSTPTPPTTSHVFLTPALRAATMRFFVPGLLAICLLAALGALEITKRPRFDTQSKQGNEDGDAHLRPIAWSQGGVPQ